MPTRELNDALLDAIKRADAEAVAALLAQGADANVRDGTAFDNPAVIVAFRKQTIVFPPSLPGDREERFYHYAENLPIIETLLQHGANPNVHNAIGSTPLTLAAQHHKLELLQLLLRYGADINAPDGHGTSPLMWSVIMHAADMDHNLAVIALLLDQGAAVDAQNAGGNTALLYAVAHTRLPVVRFLLERRANVNLADNQGRTPLAYARQIDLQAMHPIRAILEQYGARG